jgi:hypothetical protein
MVKAIKITELGEVSIVEPEEDEDYKAMGARHGGRDSWELGVPERWEHKKFRLSMTTLGFFTEEDDLNLTATYLWAHLRTGGQQPILGTVFLFNETKDEVIDMTMEDFGYIFDCMKKGCSTCGKDYTICKSWHKK